MKPLSIKCPRFLMHNEFFLCSAYLVRAFMLGKERGLKRQVLLIRKRIRDLQACYNLLIGWKRRRSYF